MRDIREYIKNFSGQTLYWYPNPGNAGDALIAHATHLVFKQTGVNYEMVKSPFNNNNGILVYGGGGNLVDYYNNCANFISKYHRQVKRLILLPHTISGHEDLLRSLGSNVDIFCREKYSYNHVKKFAKNANVFLSDDMALHLELKGKHFLSLNAENITSHFSRPIIPHLFNIFKTFLGLKAAISKQFSLHRNKELNCFRNDSEKTSVALPVGNLDLSKILEFSFSEIIGDANVCRVISSHLLYLLNLADVINTNRLHICIGGALLGKKINFYPNCYFKNQAVYEASLKYRFPLVKWHGN